MEGKVPPLRLAESELDISKLVKIYWDPIPIDWWAHLKWEQKVVVMRQQLMVARARIEANITISNAMIAAVDVLNKTITEVPADVMNKTLTRG